MEVEVIGMGVEEETSSTPSGWFQFKLNAHSSILYTIYLIYYRNIVTIDYGS